MLMAGDRSNLWYFEEGLSYNEDGDFEDNMSMDVGSFFDILNEKPDTFERRQEDSSFNDVPQGSSMFSPSYNVGPSDLRTGISDGFLECGEKSAIFNNTELETTLQFRSPVYSASGSLSDQTSVEGHGCICPDKNIVSQNASSSSLQDGKEMIHEMPNCSETFSFPTGCSNNHVAGIAHSSKFRDLDHDSELQFTYLGPEYSSEKLLKKENNLKVSVAPNAEEYPWMEIGLTDDRLAGCGNQLSSSPYIIDMLDRHSSASKQFNSYSFDINSSPHDDNKMTSVKEKVEHLTQVTSSNSMMTNPVDKLDDGIGELPTREDLADKGLSDHNGVGNYVSFSSNFSTFNCNNEFRIKHETHVNDRKKNKLNASGGIASQLSDDIMGMTSCDDAAWHPGEASNLLCSGYFISNSCGGSEIFAKEKKCELPESKRPCLSLGDYDGTTSGMPMPGSVVHDHYLDVWEVNPSVPVISPIKQELLYRNLKRDSRPSLPVVNGPQILNVSGQKIQSDSLVQSCDTDDDADLCILEDISVPVRPYISAVNGKSPVSSQHTVICGSLNSTGAGHIKVKANGERVVFRAALQDLCQPKTEDAPPEGLMAVPLLRHQRIALSWMVRKEKAVSCCGGILADDQGLGKTISTIALILKERSPSSVESNRKQSEPETLNLDDDDDDNVLDVGESNQGAESCQVNGSFCGRKTAPVRAKLRPAAGTLIVCPTSVLRQWSEELQNKVTSKANLSVLVYHGSNRTKDPHELAKYDVVLTTYAIVSMEVPKKPLVDEEDDDTKGTSDSPMELSSSKKRKYPPNSNKKSSKSKKGVDVDLLDVRPLAGVGWFRVVLDEAQSIKNHRTQVARACWGLRAKRRWCLSGTPMQNAVDDLYSYFRFLKFDPYSAYKAFCSGIKVPIHRSPASGYKKLQAVLTTIMLRRTKGTLIDGEPIVNLPPKTIKLLKVDFTPEERDFYQTLEADSRAQFAEYAAAGTVKQNYVNILLMLLRLRQACDHPLLVRGFSSGSKLISSVEMAKKLPREKQLHLFHCYEASLAICGICNDPPEDAVVTSCGHVFCNQCICEHLSGDDTNCPATNCKTHLNEFAVFSVATLRCSLFDQPTLDSISDCSHPKLEETSEPLSSGCGYDSSKIKAALEVLQSLNKRQDHTITSSPSYVEEGTPSAENASGLHSSRLHESVCDEENKGRDEASRGSVKEMGEKAIVFSQWTRMLDLLEDCLKNSSIHYRRLDGTMSIVARDKAVKDFNTRPEVSVMIMSLKAASLGLNMVAACHVLLLDLWWNPTTEDQAIDRAHRIGQTRPVTVLRLTVKDTVEDRILALQLKKREMVAAAFGEDNSGSRDTRLTVEDLNYLFS